ncbi:MAG: DnaJ domain-containing protein [Alphaproteobacteria bacterium]|nr:DnaJ domain-containing protein [Alphaproteobacteria bacterium]
MPDYYKILGVDKDADDETIAKAYKALAKRLHPDANATAGGEAGERASQDGERLREVIEAYRALRKPVGRLAYDETCSGRRAELRRRILFIAVLTLAASVTLASLAAAYMWRTELLHVQEMARRPVSLGDLIAGRSASQAQPAPAPRQLDDRLTAGAPLASAPAAEPLPLPQPAAATSPAAGEVAAVTGPVSVARSVHALLAAKAGEVIDFVEVAVRDVAEEADSGIEAGSKALANAGASSDAGSKAASEAQTATDGPGAPRTSVGPHIIEETLAAPSAPAPVPAPMPAPAPMMRQRPPSTVAAVDSDPLPLPDRPPPQAERAHQPVFTRDEALAFVSEQYLSGATRNRRRLLGLYCSRVDYWGEKATSRTSVVNQIADFASRWPFRTYKLRPATFEFAPAGQPLKYNADFTYEFTVASGYGYGGAAGIASGRLTIERQNGRWRICSEHGRVLQRTALHSGPGSSHGSGMAAANSSKYSSRPGMDMHRVLFGE